MTWRSRGTYWKRTRTLKAEGAPVDTSETGLIAKIIKARIISILMNPMSQRRTKNGRNPLKREAWEGAQGNMRSAGVNDWSDLLGSGTL